MRGGTADTWARRLGAAFGIGLVAAAATLSTVQGGSGRGLGADVTFASTPSGELAVSPAGPFVRGLDLAPGSARHPATGEVDVRNQTGTKLQVHVRALPSIADLDEILMVDLSVGDSTVYDGPLGSLRTWTPGGFVLVPGETATLHLDAHVPSDVTDGYQGRIADVGIQFLATTAGA